MVVQAVDQGVPALSSTALVTITVLSSTVQPPRWIIPASGDYIEYIREVCFRDAERNGQVGQLPYQLWDYRG